MSRVNCSSAILNSSLLIKACLDGKESVASGWTLDFQLIDPSTENQKISVRSKQVLAEKWNHYETHCCQIPRGGTKV